MWGGRTIVVGRVSGCGGDGAGVRSRGEGEGGEMGGGRVTGVGEARKLNDALYAERRGLDRLTTNGEVIRNLIPLLR